MRTLTSRHIGDVQQIAAVLIHSRRRNGGDLRNEILLVLTHYPHRQGTRQIAPLDLQCAGSGMVHHHLAEIETLSIYRRGNDRVAGDRRVGSMSSCSRA